MPKQPDTNWLDFLVDGISLHETLGVGEESNVGVLGWIPPDSEEAHVGRLLLEEPSHLETGRIELYVCRLCADIGCGSVTCLVEARGDHVIWRDFGLEYNYRVDDGELYELYQDVEPIEFDVAQYRDALLNRPRPRAAICGSSPTANRYRADNPNPGLLGALAPVPLH